MNRLDHIVRVPRRQSQVCLCALVLLFAATAYGQSTMRDLKVNTRAVRYKDSDGRQLVAHVPEFVRQGGFLERGEQAIVGQGLEKTLHHTTERTRLYRQAFSSLANDRDYYSPSDKIATTGAMKTFAEAFHEVDKLAHDSIPKIEYETLRSTLLVAAEGLRDASRVGDGEATKKIYEFSRKLSAMAGQLKRASQTGELPKTYEPAKKALGEAFADAMATADVIGIIAEGVQRHQTSGGVALERLSAIKKAYVDRAGGLDAARKQFLAEMEAIEQEHTALLASTSLAGAVATAIHENREVLMKDAGKIAAAKIKTIYGAKIGGAVTAKLVAAGATKASVAASGSLLAVGVAVEALIIKSQLQQGENVRMATVYANVAFDLESAATSGDPGGRLSLMALQAANEHNTYMLKVSDVLLGKFRGSYQMWNKYYQEAAAESQQELDQVLISRQADDTITAMGNTLKKLTAADLLQAAAAEGKLPLTDKGIYALMQILKKAGEMGLEIPNFELLVKNPKALGTFLQGLAKAANQPELTREIEAWVGKPEQLASLLDLPKSSDIDEQIKRNLAQGSAASSELRDPLETDAGMRARSTYAEISGFLRHPAFTAFSSANQRFSPIGARGPGQPVGTASPTNAGRPGLAGSAMRSPGQTVTSGWSTGDMQWARQMQGAAQRGNWDRFMTLGGQGIRDGRTTRIGLSAGVGAATLKKGNAAAQGGVNAYFKYRKQGGKMPTLRLK